MSITVTMRPRRFSTPAISRSASGTRVTRSGMNTSWTREIGRPNSWPPIIAVTYSTMAPSPDWVFLVMCVSPDPSRWLRCCAAQLGGTGGARGLFLQRRDQTGTVELGDIVVEAGLTAALDRRRRHQRGQSDDRHRAQIAVGADHFGELEPVHVGHLDVGQDHVEALRTQRSQALLRGRRGA